MKEGNGFSAMFVVTGEEEWIGPYQDPPDLVATVMGKKMQCLT
jgi:hypothetical protein